MGKKAGDELILIIEGDEKCFTICGIYSDVTNGGKTAKAVFETSQEEILWSSIPVSFKDSTETGAKVEMYRDMFPFAKVSGVEEHMGQTVGSTIAAIKTASRVSMTAAIMLTILVTLLFMKLLVTKDRYSIAILKSIGFSGSDVQKQYITRGVVVLIAGLTIGTILSNTAGELVGVALISSFGASAFNFVVNPLFTYMLSPLLMALCVYIAILPGISGIRPLKIAEFIKEV